MKYVFFQIFVQSDQINKSINWKSFLFLQVFSMNKNIKMRSFKSRENIQKKEGGPDRSVSDNQSSSEKTKSLSSIHL